MIGHPIKAEWNSSSQNAGSQWFEAKLEKRSYKKDLNKNFKHQPDKGLTDLTDFYDGISFIPNHLLTD